MKVLSIGDYSANLGVYEAQIMQFVIMHNRGVDVTIQGHFSEEIRALLNENNIKVIEDKPEGKNDIVFIARLFKNVNKQNFTIVHVFGGRNLSNTCIALKKTKVKIIAYMGSTSIHWHDIFAYRTYLNPRIDAVICNSKANALHFKKQLFGKRKNKVYTIYKGYSPDWFLNIKPNNLSEFGIKPSSLVIVSIGNKRKVKAMDLFLKAINYVNNIKILDIHFVLVGKGTDDKKMNKLKHSLTYPEQVHLLGFRTDTKEILKRADIYLQTSIKEGLGRAITESMCLKKPVIVTKAGGCVELVDEGLNGCLANNRDALSIARKINYLTTSEKKRKKFGTESLKRIKTIFNIEITVDKTLKLYHLLLNSN